jgi:hypothetical protein
LEGVGLEVLNAASEPALIHPERLPLKENFVLSRAVGTLSALDAGGWCLDTGDLGRTVTVALLGIAALIFDALTPQIISVGLLYVGLVL